MLVSNAAEPAVHTSGSASSLDSGDAVAAGNLGGARRGHLAVALDCDRCHSGQCVSRLREARPPGTGRVPLEVSPPVAAQGRTGDAGGFHGRAGSQRQLLGEPRNAE